MNSFWRIFSLELIAFVRSKALAMLVVSSVLWMYALPYIIRGDGTAEGFRELYIRYSIGGVFALLVIVLLSAATASIAVERSTKRLQLTLVRPVHYFVIVLAKAIAHIVVGAGILLISMGILATRTDLTQPCNHVLKPRLPSPREEAKAMYEAFMADPSTPVEAKRAKKEIVLRLLENKAVDHYQTIPTNEVAEWTFPLETSYPQHTTMSVRLRFTNQFDTRDEVRGLFELGRAVGVVSNITQSVLTIPLIGIDEKDVTIPERLTFRNQGKNPLMLRPRKDLDILIPADSFFVNMVRAYGVLVAILALLISLGLLLSVSLSRSVALFVAIVMVLLSEMSPSVVEQYPDELETKTIDRIGLIFTRVAADVTRPVSSLNPLEKLSSDECVELSVMIRALAINALFAPLLLAILSGIVLPRKQDDI